MVIVSDIPFSRVNNREFLTLGLCRVHLFTLMIDLTLASTSRGHHSFANALDGGPHTEQLKNCRVYGASLDLLGFY
jgi:hypothetical protein